MKSLFRALATAVAIAAVGLSVTGPAQAAGPVLELTSIGFDRSQVDVTESPATAALTWTITDRSAKAESVVGAIELRQFAGTVPIGEPHTVTYDVNLYRSQVVGSGTAQKSTYTYNFGVPQYSSVAEAVWRVTKVTIADDVAHARTVRAPGPAELAVTQLVDRDGPVVEELTYPFGQPTGFYDDGSGVAFRYVVQFSDQTALKNGRLTVAGPGGRRLSSTFRLTRNGSQWSCNGEVVSSPTWGFCSVSITLPAGTPSGRWRVARLDLTDSWGNTRSDTSPEGPAPVQVSRNDVLSASDFAFAPAEVNNWLDQTTTTLTFRPHGAVGGVTAVEVDAKSCYLGSDTPTTGDDGSVSVLIRVPAGTSNIPCPLRGVKLTDRAGNVAFYGTAYGAPDLGLPITQVPDEKAPVVLSARLQKATWTQQEANDAWGISFEVAVEVDEFAPIASAGATIYDSSGEALGGSTDGGGVDSAGVLHLAVSGQGLTPGQYTIAVQLIDRAGNHSFWGAPGRGNPIPGGPLVVTVTE